MAAVSQSCKLFQFFRKNLVWTQQQPYDCRQLYLLNVTWAFSQTFHVYTWLFFFLLSTQTQVQFLWCTSLPSLHCSWFCFTLSVPDPTDNMHLALSYEVKEKHWQNTIASLRFLHCTWNDQCIASVPQPQMSYRADVHRQVQVSLSQLQPQPCI